MAWVLDMAGTGNWIELDDFAMEALFSGTPISEIVEPEKPKQRRAKKKTDDPDGVAANEADTTDQES